MGEIWQHANGMAPGDVLSDLNFSSNIVYVDRRAGSALFGGSWLGNSSFASNLYWNESGEHARERLWLGCVFTPMALQAESSGGNSRRGSRERVRVTAAPASATGPGRSGAPAARTPALSSPTLSSPPSTRAFPRTLRSARARRLSSSDSVRSWWRQSPGALGRRPRRGTTGGRSAAEGGRLQAALPRRSAAATPARPLTVACRAMGIGAAATWLSGIACPEPCSLGQPSRTASPTGGLRKRRAASPRRSLPA